MRTQSMCQGVKEYLKVIFKQKSEHMGVGGWNHPNFDPWGYEEQLV